MSNTISLTVPRDDETALVAGATMLLTLAGKVPAMELPDMRDPCVGCGGDTVTVGGMESHGLAPQSDVEFTTGPEIHDIRIPPDAPIGTEVQIGDGPIMEKVEAPAEPDDSGVVIGPEPGDEFKIVSALDADGLPWDARIHSSSKNKIADGTWRKKRGVDQADYDRVVDELRQLMAVPSATGAPVAHSPVVNAPPATDVPPPPPVVTEPATVAPPPLADDGTPATFTEFLKAVSHKIQNKERTMADVTAALPEGVANLQLLNGRQDLIPQVWAALVAEQ